MSFQELLPTSGNKKQIPHPEDFGLESFIQRVFGNLGGDFIDKQDILSYAKSRILRMETDPAIIKQRQDVLQEFMLHPHIVHFVLGARIPAYKPDYQYWDDIHLRERHSTQFCNRLDRARAYINYIVNLAFKIAEENHTCLQDTQAQIQDEILSSDHIKQVRTAIKDIDSKATLEVRIGRDAGITATFASGAQATSGSMHYDYERTYFPQNKLINAIDRHIVEHTPKKEGSKYSCLNRQLTATIDQTTGKITARITYTLYEEKFEFKRIFRLENPWYKVEHHRDEEIDLTQHDIREADFNLTILALKEDKYLETLQSVNKDIEELKSTVIELRYLAAAARYFKQLEQQGIPTTRPTITDAATKITDINGLINPDLVDRLSPDKIVPNDVTLDSEHYVNTLTGPNNNGKTNHKNALGIAQASAQAGLNVTAKEATLSIKDTIHTHYIKPGDIVVGESRYAHELSRIRDLFEQATNESLILIDEPFTGTSPEDGKEELIGVINTLRFLGATSLISTHYHDVARETEKLPGVQSLQCIAEEQGDELRYTYKITEGISGKSNGTYLARKMEADETGLMKIVLAKKPVEKVVQQEKVYEPPTTKEEPYKRPPIDEQPIKEKPRRIVVYE